MVVVTVLVGVHRGVVVAVVTDRIVVIHRVAVTETVVVTIAVATTIAVETMTAVILVTMMAAVVVAGMIETTITAVVAIIVETTGTVAVIIVGMTGAAGTVVHQETEATVVGLVVVVARVRHQGTEDAVVRRVHLGGRGTMVATVVIATVVEVVRRDETTGVGRRTETAVVIGAIGAVDTVLKELRRG
jgi:hypothetical protein